MSEEGIQLDGRDGTHRPTPDQKIADSELTLHMLQDFEGIIGLVAAKRDVVATRVATTCEIKMTEMEPLLRDATGISDSWVIMRGTLETRAIETV